MATILFAIVLLAGCNQQKFSEEPNEVPIEEDAMQETTTDPMIAGDKTSNIRHLEKYSNEWEVKGWYKTEGTDDKGFNHIEKDGIEIDYAIVSVNGEPTGDTVAALGEIRNNTDKPIHLNGFSDIFTDQGEQADLSGFVETLRPGARAKLMGYVEGFDYGLPADFELETPVVWLEQEDGEAKTIYLIEETKKKFTKE